VLDREVAAISGYGQQIRCATPRAPGVHDLAMCYTVARQSCQFSAFEKHWAGSRCVERHTDLTIVRLSYERRSGPPYLNRPLGAVQRPDERQDSPRRPPERELVLSRDWASV